MKDYRVKKLVEMAILLTICLSAQYFKSISQFITGPIVNATIILAVLLIGLTGGLAISVLSPLCAMLLGFAPIMQMLPQMILAVSVGNMVLALIVWILKKHLIAGLAVGTVLKAASLWVMVSLIVIPTFAAELAPPQQALMKAMFSYNQLFTAAIGSVIAYFVYNKLYKADK